MSEVVAQDAIRKRLAPLVELVEDLDSLYESVLTAFSDFPREGPSAKVGLILFARLANDIRVCTWAAQLGYGLQAVTLAGTIVELVGSLCFVGQDDGRATEWTEHTDRRRSYPSRVGDGIDATLNALGVTDEAARRNWGEAYEFMCWAKHANPRVTLVHGLRIDPSGGYFMHGPDTTPLGISMSAQALWHSIGFGGTGAFVATSHCANESVRTRLSDEAAGISQRLAAIDGWFQRVLDEAEEAERQGMTLGRGPIPPRAVRRRGQARRPDR